MWCAMKLARGLNIVKSLPRSRMSELVGFNRFAQFVVADHQVATLGMLAGSLMPAICRLRHSSNALGAVV